MAACWAVVGVNRRGAVQQKTVGGEGGPPLTGKSSSMRSLVGPQACLRAIAALSTQAGNCHPAKGEAPA